MRLGEKFLYFLEEKFFEVKTERGVCRNGFKRAVGYTAYSSSCPVSLRSWFPLDSVEAESISEERFSLRRYFYRQDKVLCFKKYFKLS
jgi:hypothetical protein